MESLIYLVVGVAVLFSSYGLLGAGVQPVPVLGLIFAGAFILSLWVTLRLHNAWQKLSPAERANNLVLDQMRWLFTFGTLFVGFDSFPHVILPILGFSDQFITTAHWVTHLFLFVYLIIAARMAVSFFHPEWKNYATAFVVIVSIAALAVSLMKPDYLVYIPGSVYPLVSSDPLYALFNMISDLTSLGLFGVYLVINSLTHGTLTTRIRACLLAIGFWANCWVGYLVHYSHAPNTFQLIYTGLILWTVCTGLGALYGATWRRN
jgi:hypothetical protein